MSLEDVQKSVHISAVVASEEIRMDVLSFTETRARLKDVMDRVVEDHAPVVITRQRAESVVIVSLADWNAMEETTRLLSSRKNAERLSEAIAQLDAGQGTEREPIES
jgi:antitoxin YefM